jgi:hypothetical protein
MYIPEDLHDKFHKIPTHHKSETLGSEELEKLYTHYMRQEKLERILKK